MSIAFSQTVQALQADQGRFSLLSLSVAVAIMLLWCVWLLYAPIYLYASSSQLRVTSVEQPTWKLPSGGQRPAAYKQYEIRVQFKPTDADQIKAGQPAKLHLSSADTLPRGPLAAEIKHVDSQDGVVVLLLELPADQADSLLGGAKIERADVAIGTTSPLHFLMHNSFVLQMKVQ